MASALGRADARAGPASLRVLIGVDLWFDLVRDIARFFDCKGFELRNADAHGPLKSTCSADASQDRTVRMSVSAVAVSTLAPHGRVSARSKARATAGNAPPPSCRARNARNARARVPTAPVSSGRRRIGTATAKNQETPLWVLFPTPTPRGGPGVCTMFHGSTCYRLR